MADRKGGGPKPPYTQGVDTKDGRMYQPDMVAWGNDPERLELLVRLPGNLDVYSYVNGKRVYHNRKAPETTYVKFLHFHRTNPEVLPGVAELARKERSDLRRVGIRMLLEAYRWNRLRADRPEGQEEFAISNDIFPYYGRLLMATGGVPVDMALLQAAGGEPGWWCEFLALAHGNARRQNKHKEAEQIENRLRGAMTRVMLGTEEQPPT